MFQSFNINAAGFKLAMFLIGFLTMFCIETMRPCRGWDVLRRARLLFHLGLSILNNVILRLTVVGPLLMWLGVVNSRGWGICPLFGFEGSLQIIVCLVIFDLFDYWWHRWNHRIGLLWRFHKVHHVDTQVDVTTSMRFHPGELLISSVFKAGWILILGPSLWTFVIFEVSVTLASQFHHANIDFSDSVESILRSVIVTPRYHTAHHTVKRRTGNNNFSAVLIFWDKLFGTYFEPDFEEMKQLGLANGRDSYLSIAATLKGPFAGEY